MYIVKGVENRLCRDLFLFYSLLMFADVTLNKRIATTRIRDILNGANIISDTVHCDMYSFVIACGKRELKIVW